MVDEYGPAMGIGLVMRIDERPEFDGMSLGLTFVYVRKIAVVLLVQYAPKVRTPDIIPN